jgi:hypothetical protein
LLTILLGDGTDGSAVTKAPEEFFTGHFNFPAFDDDFDGHG